ncbi:MAG: branched-chain amino acid transport system II carrier protein [Patescibacteria group bacterium]|nr:branched-chain amino acid transport system II carrier protein [Patescibacteria group bacterium]
MGYILTPLLVIFCLVMISAGLFVNPEVVHIQAVPQNFFMYGLVEGYFTFNAIAACSLLACCSLACVALPKTKFTRIWHLTFSCFGQFNWWRYAGRSFILGLAAVSAKHGHMLAQNNIPPEQILTALAYYLLPGKLGIFASMIVILACLTTALALTKLFAEFLQDISKNRISYIWGLVITLGVTWIMSTLGFSGLLVWFAPIIKICYPIVIALSIYNAAGWIYTRFQNPPLAARRCFKKGGES